MKVSIDLIGHNGVKGEIPKYATNGSAGADLTACIAEPIVVTAGKIEKIPTGIAIAVPEGYAAFIYARSGLASKFGIAPVNCVGVVDSDYRGEVLVALMNHSDKDYTIEPFERIAQLVIAPVVQAEFIEEALSATQRGKGGFGSTGKQ